MELMSSNSFNVLYDGLIADQQYLTCLIFWTVPATKQKDKIFIGHQNGAHIHSSATLCPQNSLMNLYKSLADFILCRHLMESALERMSKYI